MQTTAVTQRAALFSASQYALPLVALFVLIGAYLRLANLGALGFRWDEDLSALAARAILENGIPLLPSGMIYPRGGALLYMMAASAELLGFSELALRLPAALFGIALIPLGYAFGRALFDARVGLVVAGLLTISQWDVEFARYARMYAPFAFFYVLTLHCLWRYRIERVSARGSILGVVFAVCAVHLHQLGYTLVPAFFLPLLLGGPRQWKTPRNWVYPVVSGGVVAVFFFSWSTAIDRWMRGFAGVTADTVAATDTVATDGAAAGSGLLAKVPLFAALLEAAPIALLALAAVPLLTAAVTARRIAAPPLHRMLLALVVACCVLQLFNVALLGLLALAFLKQQGIAAFRRPDVLLAAVLIGATFAAWVALATILGLGPSNPAAGATGMKGVVRALLDYPHFFIFWGFAREWPMASAVALVGALWAFDRASQPPSPSGLTGNAAASAFLLVALGTPLISNGLFDTAYQLFRYNVPLNTLYFTLIGLGLVHWRELVPALPRPVRRIVPGGVTVTALLALTVLAFDLNPLRAWLVVQRGYGSADAAYGAFELEPYPDYRTTSGFIVRSAAEDDLIVVLDSREYYNYLGRVDYWVRTAIYETQTYERNGVLHDSYVGTPLIMSLQDLQEVLAEPQRTKWLAASDEMLRTTRAVSDDIKAFILERDENVVYVGLDGKTKVYRFD